MVAGALKEFKMLWNIGSILMASCEQNRAEKPATSRTTVDRPRHGERAMYELAMIGWRVWVGIPELEDDPLLAKMDTGAWSNTLDVRKYDIIQGDLEDRIRFWLTEDGDDFKESLFDVEKDWRIIRNTGGHTTKRPVIRTSLEIAGMDFDIEVCLQDRSLMRHRFILGRKFLRERFCVHPGRQCIHPNERTQPRIVLRI